jgi:D-alanyl-D-alanine carboxypeptidase
VIWLKDAHKKREVASLTKIMTCHLAILLIEKYNFNITELTFRVSQKASALIGTSADLKFRDKVALNSR